LSSRFVLLVGGLFLLGRGALVAQQVSIETEPARPARGALIRLRVTPSTAEPMTGLEGEAAEEPLHFSQVDTIAWTSLAGVPVEGDDSLRLTLVLRYGERRDTVYTAIAVARASYPTERLNVAPKMASPDSAAQVRIAGEIALAREVSRSAHQSPRRWSEPFLLPRDSRITSGYGTGRQYNGKLLSRHLGTDFAGAVGAPVHATNAGRVALVADFYLAGRVLYLDHGEGLISAYFHLSKTLVKQGDIVERGQLIGAVGSSGRVTGPHLHWVMRYGGTTIDPMSVMALLGAP
jgi:murein DD-endopeptidase MepM/ murein hydrolase activator NlpD